MMKKLPLFSLLILLIASCGGEASTTSETANIEEITELPEFTIYDDPYQVLLDAGDYSEESGCLKSIQNGPAHEYQISSMVFEGDDQAVIKQMVKHDLIYVAYQLFAQSEIDQVTVTSIPLKMKDFTNSEGFLEEEKLTKTITREKAASVMSETIGITDFKLLYQPMGTMWLPSDAFNKLKDKRTAEVCRQL